MISRIFIIAPGGKLCFFKSFLRDDDVDKDIVSGFLSAFNDLAKELTAGDIKKFSFRNFTYIYDTDSQIDCMYVMVMDTEDLEEEAREKLKLMKIEFIKRYADVLRNWDGNVTKFRDFNEFVADHIYIPPKIIITGQKGVGKTTILDLFPGETVVNLDKDLNEVIEKRVKVSGFEKVKEIVLREVDLEDLIYKPKRYGDLLKSAEIICIVTNSLSANLGSTNKLIVKLKELDYRADLYVIANFQDKEDVAFSPKKIEDAFRLTTYPLSAITSDAQNSIFSILGNMLTNTFVEKDIKMLKNLIRSPK